MVNGWALVDERYDWSVERPVVVEFFQDCCSATLSWP
jgi:hypothetical protein